MNRSKVPLAAFRTASTGQVRVHPEHAAFAYSDGSEVESGILQVLQQTRDLSVGSQELLARIQDWPTEYHFSDTRANLLRHLPFGPGVRVLELGAGCGAITRLLGEAGCMVAAVEGSLLRARCARERTRDLGNVSVYCSDFQHIAFSREFDVVTLVGVLEYAPKFFAGEDPIGACLAVARSALATGGTLVVGIENQLGLKYFAGATEDHLGTHFSGIEDRYLPDGVRTMGRRQLQRKLQGCGFADVSFQYPFPDYKLPVAMVFEAGLQRRDFRPSEIVRHQYARDYSGQDLRSIDASQVWPVLEENGLLGELSNSFLILAHEEPLLAKAGGTGGELLALGYSAGRAKRFQTRTSFRAGEDGAIVCEKELLYPSEGRQKQPEAGIAHRLTREAYVCGPTLHSAIAAALRSGDPAHVIALLRRWLDFLEGQTGAGPDRTWGDRLPGEYWDCTPANLIDSAGVLHFIDAEWISHPGPTWATLLLRYVGILAYGESSGVHFASCFQSERQSGMGLVAREIGLSLTQEMLDEFAKDTNEKNAVIFPLKPKVALHCKDFLANRRRPSAGSVLAPGVRLVHALSSKLLRGLRRALAR
jgi:cyclopropane fatty-acyl-phospholipid synthase-like methyltransferase